MSRRDDSSELNRLTTFPNWFLQFLAAVVGVGVCGVIPWAYSIGNDLASIRTSLNTCVERLVDQDRVNNRQDREIGGLKERMSGVESRLKP